MIGVTGIRGFLDTDGDGVTGMHDMIAHIEYIATLVGVDHVGISSDTYVDGWEESSGHYVNPRSPLSIVGYGSGRTAAGAGLEREGLGQRCSAATSFGCFGKSS